MVHSSCRVGRTKTIAEVLAMIADAHPEIAPTASGPGVRRMVMGVRHRILRGAEPLYVERKGRIKDSPRVT
jgi:hypothetical protein